MTTTSQLSTTEPKKNKNKLSKQLEEEQIHRTRDHMGCYKWGGKWGRMGGKVTGNKKHK